MRKGTIHLAAISVGSVAAAAWVSRKRGWGLFRS